VNTYCAKGSMFKGNSNIFQFNTENKVYVIQAPSKSKKKEICNMIRIIGGMQSLIQSDYQINDFMKKNGFLNILFSNIILYMVYNLYYNY